MAYNENVKDNIFEYSQINDDFYFVIVAFSSIAQIFRKYV
jgi:hypothetical protein